MAHRGLAGVLLLSVTATVLAGGCGGGDQQSRPSAVPSTSKAATTAPPVAVSPAPAPSASPVKTDAAGLVIPAETAGDLDARSVPQAPDLGRGWTRYVDPGDVAEGYTGNGSWVRARGVTEVVQAVVPLGCVAMPTPPVLPVPQHALEATYRGPGGAPGVALVLDYSSEGQASRFLAGMEEIARACPSPAAKVRSDDPLTSVVTPFRLGANTVLDRRREYGVGASEWLWSEMVVRVGPRVGLLIIASNPSAAKPDLVVLSDRLRAAVPR